MTTPDTVIAALKAALDAQSNVIVELKERLQDAEARAGECEAWEAECQRLTKLHAESVHVPWAVFDEIVRDLENGNARHALDSRVREARS